MAQDNPFDQFDTPTAAPARAPRPLRGAPPKPDKPNEPKTTYRTLEPDEVKARGLDPTVVYQISSEGNVSAVSGQKNSDKPTEYQSKSNQFYGRMLAAEKQYRDTPEDSRDARTVPGQWLHETFPGVDATFNSSGRNSSDNAARNWIAASLRQESGAAISTQEYDNQYRIFFPMPGDGPEQIKQKAEARKQAMMGFRTSSGPLAEEADKQYNAQYGPGMPWDAQDGGATPGAPDGGGNKPNPFEGLPGRTEVDGGLYDESGNFIAPDPRRLGIDPATYTPPPGVLYRYKDENGNWVNEESISGSQANPYEAGLNLPPNYEQQLIDTVKAQTGDPTSAQNWIMRAANGGLFGFSDEVNGLKAGGKALINGQDPMIAYRVGRDLEQMRQHLNEKGQGSTGYAVEFGASLPTAALGGVARTPAELAKVGAKFGAVSGLGHGNGVGGSVLGAATGAGLGGVLGGALGVGAEKASPYLGKASEFVSTKLGRNKPIPEGFDAGLVAAGERQNIPIRQPDAVPSMRGDMASAEASPYGGGLVANALRNDKAAVETRLSEIGGKGESMVGDSMDYSVGKMGRKVGEDFIERTRVQKNDLYGEAEQLAQGQRIVPEEAIATVDRHIAELEARGANTNSPTINYLKGLREDMNAPGGFSITEFQGLRSGASQKIKGDQALTSSDADRRLGDVVKAFTADAEAQLPQGAAAKLAEADKFYAQRQEFIDGTLKKLIGTRGKPASSEEVGKRLVAMTRNKADAEALGKVLKEATPEQRADFSATVAENLGIGRNGEFSLGALATNIGKMPGNVRVLIFGKEGNAALSDLQAIARAKSETAGGLNNSRSGVVMVRDMAKRLLFSTTVGAGAGGAGGGTSGAVMGGVVIPAATELVTAIGQRRAAKLLLDTNFTKWLRQAPKKATVAEANAYVDKLAAALGGSPETAAIVDNVVPLFRDRLTGSATQSATAAAANDEKQDRRRQPPGQ